MKINFNDAANLTNELYQLREQAENKPAFDLAVEWMTKQRFICDIKTGSVKNRDGFASQFIDYDWSDIYQKCPHFIFYDFFRGFLMNKYSLIVRGLDNA